MKNVFLQRLLLDVGVHRCLHGLQQSIFVDKGHLHGQEVLCWQCAAITACGAGQECFFLASQLAVYGRTIRQELHQELAAIFLSTLIVEIKHGLGNNSTRGFIGQMAGFDQSSLGCRRLPQTFKSRQSEDCLQARIDKATRTHVTELHDRRSHVSQQTLHGRFKLQLVSQDTCTQAANA